MGPGGLSRGEPCPNVLRWLSDVKAQSEMEGCLSWILRRGKFLVGFVESIYSSLGWVVTGCFLFSQKKNNNQDVEGYESVWATKQVVSVSDIFPTPWNILQSRPRQQFNDDFEFWGYPGYDPDICCRVLEVFHLWVDHGNTKKRYSFYRFGRSCS